MIGSEPFPQRMQLARYWVLAAETWPTLYITPGLKSAVFPKNEQLTIVAADASGVSVAR